MGLFSRLRTSSNSSPRTDTPTSSPPQPPPPSSHITPSSSTHLSPASSTHLSPPTPSAVRPAHPPSSPSTSSITSRLSRKPWRRKRAPSGYGHDGGGLVPGPEYGSPPRGPAGADRQEDNLEGQGKRTTMIYLGSKPEGKGVGPISPTSTLSRALDLSPDARADMASEEQEERKRISSGEFTQEGGILGVLGFEKPSFTSPPSTPHPLGESTGGLEGEGASQEEDLSAERRRHAAVQDGKEVVVMAAPADGQRTSEEQEVLESPEKRKFWKGKGRARGMSKGMSDLEDSPSGSPTPRKASGIISKTEPSSPIAPSRPSADLHHPRPQQLRRPSSSLFHNPFHRSHSRVSLHHDIEAPSGDDGSFQLKGFRHISGTSDVEGAGGLEGYLAHVKRESTYSLGFERNPPAGDTGASPPSAFAQARPRPPPPARPPISRPPSVAASLASVDDMIAGSSRVSVAAFRKGIRRPSEGPASTVRPGGIGADNGDDDDDDDLPLGVRNRPFAVSRQGSAISFSSMTEDQHTDPQEASHSPLDQPMSLALDPRPLTSRTPSPIRAPSPGLNFTVQRHHRNTSGGFIVKSAKSSRADIVRNTSDRSLAAVPTAPATATPSPATESADGKPSGFASPLTSREATPALGVKEALEIVASPTSIGPVDYFGFAPLRSATPSQNDVELNGTEIGRDPEEAIRPPAMPASRVDTERRSTPPPPPPAPSDLPLSVLDLNLPLPPDQMPDTPPKSSAGLPLPRSQTDDVPSLPAVGEEERGRRRMSLLDEPLKILSGLWPGSPTTGDGSQHEDDGFDPALVVRSLSAFGDEPEATPSPSLAAHQVSRPPSRSALSEVGDGTTSDAGNVGSPLRARLNAVVAAASTPDLPLTRKDRASLARLSTGSDSLDADAALAASFVRSPTMNVSERTVSEVASTKERLPSSFAKARKVKPKTSTAALRKAGWSSSEDEDETDASKDGPKPEMISPGRKHPSGPRKLPASSLAAPTSPRKHARERRVSWAGRKGESDPEQSASSSEDESLTAVRKKASQSTVSLVAPASPPPRKAFTPPSPGRGRRPSVAPRPPSSSNVNRSPLTKPGGPSSPVQQRTVMALPGLSDRATASPSSSQSGLTSESTPANPLTPREGSLAARKEDDISGKNRIGASGGDGLKEIERHDRWAGQSRDSLRPPIASEDRRRSFSNPYAQQANWPYPHPGRGFDPAQMMMTPPMPVASPLSGGLPVGMDPSMNPDALRAMMKAQWQAHFMAAAYRASEEEWERASVTSHTDPRQRPFASPGPPPFMPMYPPPPPLSPQMMGLGGMPYFNPMGMGGMAGYSYGPSGAQSVFGGEFGPPAHLRGFGGAAGGPGSAYGGGGGGGGGGGEQSRAAPKGRGHGQGQGSPPPPSSWSRAGGRGDSDMTPRKTRPATHFAN